MTGSRRIFAVQHCARSLALLLLLLAASAGCVRVEPYQREIHSKRCMRAEPDPRGEAVRQHVHENREAALGGQGVTGGGCGCN